MKIFVKLLAGLLTVLLVVIITILANATVELTEGGVYKKIHLPIGIGEVKWNAAGSISASAPVLVGIQGPVIVNTGAALQLSAWCHDQIIPETGMDAGTRLFEGIGRGTHVRGRIECRLGM